MKIMIETMEGWFAPYSCETVDELKAKLTSMRVCRVSFLSSSVYEGRGMRMDEKDIEELTEDDLKRLSDDSPLSSITLVVESVRL